MLYKITFVLGICCLLLCGNRLVAQQPAFSAQPAPAYNALFRKTQGWVAGDGAFSVPLADGRVMWFFGDSHIGGYDTATQTVPCLFQVRNAAFVHLHNNLQQHQTLTGKGPGIPSLFKPMQGDSTWVWPGHGVQLGDTVYVTQAEFRNNGQGGNLGFESTGRYYMAKMQYPALTGISYRLLPPTGDINFTIGLVKPEKENYVYMYGYKTAGIEPEIYVARFPAKQPWSAWEYWDGKTWQPDVQKAAVIGKGASNGVNVQKVDGKYLLVSTEFSIACDQGKRVFVAVSEKPVGPFSARTPVYVIPDTLQGHYPFFYAPAVHPEFRKGHAVLVTYCINEYGPCINVCRDNRKNPDVYRPRAFWLTLN
ncbi:MAG TPA: DUF4185 domain-containing protein [Chitinophaga sp.]|uniref:DUF4185 domain-containing protein n=1 Tax=Chitinophaga sp. TaxID=1869181 RepID=UPI002DBF2165|nr:DUF4185 domain-containing protein [Chitinophaga sp.]HEU4551338.1 DUF4185 domain-containing protein [Chitinophaga sp.]